MAEERPLASITGATLIIGVIWNQSWILIGRTEAETPILWPPDVKNWLMGNDPDARTDWRQEEKGMTEDEMVGWHHWLDSHEFEQALGVGDGQGSLACCSPWGHKELDMTEWLNWSEHSLLTRLTPGFTSCLHAATLLSVPTTSSTVFSIPCTRCFLSTDVSLTLLYLSSMYNCHAFLHSVYFLALSLLGSFSSYHFLYLLNSVPCLITEFNSFLLGNSFPRFYFFSLIVNFLFAVFPPNI